MTLKLKVKNQFPASVEAFSPITLTKIGGVYQFGFDLSSLALGNTYPTLTGNNSFSGIQTITNATDITAPTPYVMSGALQVAGGATFGGGVQVFGGRMYFGTGTNTTGYSGEVIIATNGGTSGAAAGVAFDIDMGGVQKRTFGTFGSVTNGLVSGVLDDTPTDKSNKASGTLWQVIKHINNTTVTYAFTISATDFTATFGGSIATPIPVTVTGTSATVGATTSTLIINASGGFTLTFPAAATYPGRWLTIKNISAQTIISAASNVVPLAGGAAGTALLSNTAGKFARLQSDGTNWIIMEAN